jgi:hypothetical protein
MKKLIILALLAVSPMALANGSSASANSNTSVTAVYNTKGVSLGYVSTISYAPLIKAPGATGAGAFAVIATSAAVGGRGIMTVGGNVSTGASSGNQLP